MTQVANAGAKQKLAHYLGNPFVVMSLVLAMYLVKAALKITIGTMIHSPMIAGDGFHNIADLFEALAVMAVIFVARLPKDKDYPYGRQNIEFFSSLAIGGGLLYMAFKFALASLVGLLSLAPSADQAVRSLFPLPAHQPLIMDGATFPWVVCITAGSVILSIVVSRYQIAVGKKTGHASLVADGEETASDGRIEAVTLFGVLAEYLFHAPWLEYPLGLLVAFLIARTGFELLRSAWRVLLQHSIGAEHEERIRTICSNTVGVDAVAGLKTFQVGHTAVCMITLHSKRSSTAVGHIRFGIEHAVREYLTAEHFKECDIHLWVQTPPPVRHRVAFGIRRESGSSVIASTLADSTHLIICDVEHGAFVRATEEPVPADLAAWLAHKRVATMFVFRPNAADGEALSPYGIALSPATSYVPRVMGLPIS